MLANNLLAASPCAHGKKNPKKLAGHVLYSLLKSHLEKGGLPRFCPETACMDVATINPLTAAFEHFLWLRDTNVRGNKHGQTEVKESMQRWPYCHQPADNLKVSPFVVLCGFGRLCPWEVFFTVGGRWQTEIESCNIFKGKTKRLRKKLATSRRWECVNVLPPHAPRVETLWISKKWKKWGFF